MVRNVGGLCTRVNPQSQTRRKRGAAAAGEGYILFYLRRPRVDHNSSCKNASIFEQRSCVYNPETPKRITISSRLYFTRQPGNTLCSSSQPPDSKLASASVPRLHQQIDSIHFDLKKNLNKNTQMVCTVTVCKEGESAVIAIIMMVAVGSSGSCVGRLV